jgi:hypothetical protein
MAYAGWTKGSAPLLLAVRELARAEGVEEALLAEWALPAARQLSGPRGSRRPRSPCGDRGLPGASAGQPNAHCWFRSLA